MQVWSGTTHELLARGWALPVRELLDAAFRGEFADDDWDHCLGGRHVVGHEEGRPIAHAAVVARMLTVAERGRIPTGYVEGVATMPTRAGRGHGSRLMQAAGEHIRAVYPMGALSTDAVGFYSRFGWQVWRGPTWVQDGAGRTRTSDEDGGVMVLLTSMTADIDLHAAITCEWRPGDVW